MSAPRSSLGGRGTRRHDLSVLALPVLGVGASLPFASGIAGHLLLAIAVAFALAVVGVLTVGGSLPRWLSVPGGYVAGTAIAVGGLRLVASGSVISDTVFTAVLLGAVAASSARSESIGSGGAWSGAVLATGVALVARPHGTEPTTVIAAGLAVACIVVLVSAAVAGSRARLGVGGALFTGVLVGALALEAGREVSFPRSVLLPALLLSVPVLDEVCAWVTRVRRGSLPAEQLGLVGRLQARGLSKPAAEQLVVGGQVALVAAAVATAEHRLSTRSGALIGVAVVGALLFAVVVLPAAGPPGRLSRRARIVVAVTSLALLVIVGGGAAAASRIAPHAEAAQVAAERALEAARKGNVHRAERAFVQAQADFEAIRDALSGPVSSLSLAVPGIGQNVRAAREVAVVGVRLSRTGARLSSTANPHRLAVSGGSLRLDEFRRLGAHLVRARSELAAARARLRAIDARPLVAPLAGVLDVLEQRLERALVDTADVARAARVLPAILGGDGDRRYLLAVQNNGEIRGTGGFIGNFGEISAVDGNMELARFGRINDLNDAAGCFTCIDNVIPDLYQELYPRFLPTWGDINVSPDFPTVAELAAKAYPASGGQDVDGVIAIDPIALSSILRITGPVTVPTWPEPITADNVVEITLLAAYRDLPDRDERVDFLGDVAQATWSAFSQRPLGRADELVRALTEAVVGKHIIVWFDRADEQALAVDAHLTGAAPPSSDDQVFVAINNSGANKVDQFVSRDLTYSAVLEPAQHGAKFRVSSSLQIIVKNRAPTSGYPVEVIGPAPGSGRAAGESASYLKAYSPLSLESATLAGTGGVVPQTFDELGRNAFALEVFNQAGDDATMVLNLAGSVRQRPGGWYELHVARQAQTAPDHVSVTLRAAPGYRFIASDGLEIVPGGRLAASELELTGDTVLRVRVARDAPHS